MELRRENRLSEMVLESIQNSIRDGEFKPGELLPSEREMSERYGVGKSSVREAIKMLQVLGVVEPSQGRGTFLCEELGAQLFRPLLLELMLVRSNREELYELRVMFDCAVLRLASQKATTEQRSEAMAAFDELRRMEETSSPGAPEADRIFHRAILDATGNEFVIKIGCLIYDLCLPYLRQGGADAGEEVRESYKKILGIFCTGNMEGLEEAVKKSLILFRRRLGEGLPSKDRDVTGS